jgi:16S rRNA (cytosine1402-N4)-methyltransferase
VQAVDGILLDLGLSSFQVDDAERGFSFSQPGPLDMRMDTRAETTAAQLVNTLSEQELADLIWSFGEERWRRRIARNIVRVRAEAPIETTERLAEVVRKAIPAGKRSRKRHPATRTFQALRMAVNRELDNFSFHSLEDRVAKQAFAHWARSCRCPAQSPLCQCEGKPLVLRVNKKPVVPGAEEIKANPRARSGRLRVVEKAEAA